METKVIRIFRNKQSIVEQNYEYFYSMYGIIKCFIRLHPSLLMLLTLYEREAYNNASMQLNKEWTRFLTYS